MVPAKYLPDHKNKTIIGSAMQPGDFTNESRQRDKLLIYITLTAKSPITAFTWQNL